MPTRPNDVAKRTRADGQLSGLAGELFVAAELLKRGLQTSVTFGNAKSVDLFTYNPTLGRTFAVQVKTVREKLPGIHPKDLEGGVFDGNWSVFEQVATLPVAR